jgi:hypothetical protein
VQQLRADTETRFEVLTEAVGEALGEHGNKIADQAEKLTRDTFRELNTLVERRFGELMGRLDALLPDSTRPRAEKTFQFSSERDDAEIDLPNPLPPRGVIRKTTLN